MSRTFRRNRTKKTTYHDDRETSPFYIRHDLTSIREGMNQSLKAEEKNYFKKFKDTKFNQKPKSRGSSW